MKVNVLKSFVSAIGEFIQGETHDVEDAAIDDYTLENWVENGMVEVVTPKRTKKAVDPVVDPPVEETVADPNVN